MKLRKNNISSKFVCELIGSNGILYFAKSEWYSDFIFNAYHLPQNWSKFLPPKNGRL